jgi:hypothetical protein
VRRGGRKEKHNEFHNLYSSSYNIRMIKSKNMDNVRKYITHNEKIMKFIQNFSKKTVMEEPFLMPMRRQKDSIKMDLKKVGGEGVRWIQLAWNELQIWVFTNNNLNSGGYEEIYPLGYNTIHTLYLRRQNSSSTSLS